MIQSPENFVQSNEQESPHDGIKASVLPKGRNRLLNLSIQLRRLSLSGNPALASQPRQRAGQSPYVLEGPGLQGLKSRTWCLREDVISSR